ncbi:hypothetical protein Asi02nite_08160 [Asanoa siamensis]|uniref:Methyltransferase domain-containing protein n=2 Tax=Asanoa siamensis TaxID=926357 RepID=A0ABQ4CJ24_9ACTN|nr:hypothetical protein Asi02nite_08160 [Asanoa siamensis]
MLDLDAEVLHEYHRELIGWVGQESADRPQGRPAADRPRVVDLGAGSGTGSLALARELPGAEVTAVDVDPDMLAHLRARADAAGLGDRIRTVEADLDAAWPPLGPADVVWAASSMHHMADPGRALASALRVLRPGGLLVVAELESFPRFLTGTADEGLEDRAHAELARRRHEAGLHMRADWAGLIAGAGFSAVTERRFEISLRPPLSPAAARYAEVALLRMRHGLEERLAPTDLAALEKIAAGMGGRSDLTVRTTRTVWLARA